MQIYFQNVYMFLGLDFHSFWSAGWLANQRGYLAAYDPIQLAEVQYPQVPKPTDVSQYQFYPVITFFLPVFLLPFQALARIPLTPSFIFWSFINLAGSLVYLFFFSRSQNLTFGGRQIVLACLFWPFFQSMYLGQIGLILVVGVGEFLRAFLNSRPYRAGFWLGVLMIKPQILVLLPLILFLQGQWKTILAFGGSAAILMLISLGMISLQGWGEMSHLVDKLFAGYPTTVPIGMVNWRMIGENLSLMGLPAVGWGLTVSGILLTLVFLADSLWGRKINAQNAPLALLGIFAATGLVSWHYHVHSAIVLLPFYIYLLAKSQIPEKWILSWIVFPGMIMLIIDILGLIWRYTHWEFYRYYPVFLEGSTGLALSAWTAYRALRLFKQFPEQEADIA
ncbi:MAG: hypothetical protein ANABAC_2068 [Anaerolineae bacterium]|nr:MAG: hypothetical protein ANABAC_2068 [Anaerolineae bacterium]